MQLNKFQTPVTKPINELKTNDVIEVSFGDDTNIVDIIVNDIITDPNTPGYVKITGRYLSNNRPYNGWMRSPKQRQAVVKIIGTYQ